MELTLITGSYPKDICGVGDYVSKIMSTTTASCWNLYYRKDWSLKNIFKIIKEVKDTNPKTIVIEHPTQGYGWNLTPHLLTMYFGWFTRKKMVVRLHEYTQLSCKSRAAVKFMLASANVVIFTNDYDREVATSHFYRLKKRSGVVKIFTNIDIEPTIRPINDRTIDLINFGHIRPGKGLEKFIDIVSKLRNDGFNHYNIMIVGQVPNGYESYWNDIEPLCKQYNIDIKLNSDNKTVAQILNNSKLAYLPFPDGASERRGSLLASVANGAVVVTTKGLFTTPALEQAIAITDDTSCYNKIKELLLHNDEVTVIQKKAIYYLNQQIPHSWNDVAKNYLQIIETH